jgi:hypothetical protein
VLQGTSHEKSPEKAYVSEVELDKGPNEKKTRNVTKKMTKDEKMLILRSYISLPLKVIGTSWRIMFLRAVIKYCQGEQSSITKTISIFLQH